MICDEINIVMAQGGGGNIGSRSPIGTNAQNIYNIKAVDRMKGECQKLEGSRGDFDSYIWPADGFEPLTQAGTKRPVINCAADLQHQVGASPRPAHLLRLVHPAIDQEIRRAFRHCSPDTHAGAVSSGVVDQPGALAAEIFVDLVKRMPQFSGCHASGSMTVLTLVEMHEPADSIEGLLGRPCRSRCASAAARPLRRS